MHGALSNAGIATCDKADGSKAFAAGIRLGSTWFVAVSGGAGWLEFRYRLPCEPGLIQRSISRFNYTDSGDNAKSSVNFIMPVGNNRRRQPSFNSQHDTSESRFRISRGTPSPYRSPPSRRMLRYVRLLHRPTLRIPSSRFR